MRKALVIGIDDYGSAPLTGCVNDASKIAALLEKHEDQTLNCSVKLLLSSAEKITRPKVRQLVEELFQDQNEMAILYFAGHGYIKSSGGYLVTSDAARYDEGVSMDEVLMLANNSAAKNKVIILDCCHSGAMGTPRIIGSGIAQLSEGLSVLTASRDSESSLEVNGAGVFTSLLSDGLNGGAADIRGNITPGSLYAYVDEALGAWEQRPIFKSNVTSFATIRKIAPKVPFEILRKITEYFPEPSTQYSLDPTYEDTSPNPIPENVKIFKNLQRLQSVGLVVPVDAEYMYYAAMNSKSCRLTALGHQYWRLVNEKKL